MVIDRERSFVGSMNLDPRSEVFNSEMGVIIDSAPLAEGPRRRMERDMKARQQLAGHAGARRHAALEEQCRRAHDPAGPQLLAAAGGRVLQAVPSSYY